MKESQIRTFEDLKCWKACRELRIFVAKEIVPRLPKHEKYTLSNQILDAARSTTANIAITRNFVVIQEALVGKC